MTIMALWLSVWTKSSIIPKQQAKIDRQIAAGPWLWFALLWVPLRANSIIATIIAANVNEPKWLATILFNPTHKKLSSTL
jgi:hypothetical protein